MQWEEVAIAPECAECGDAWLPADEERWRAYLDDEGNVVFYCRSCAEREFGDRSA